MSERGTIRDFASGLEAQRGPEDRWLSVYEVGAMTLQHADTVRRWIAEGLIKAESRGRLGVRVAESEVERFLKEFVPSLGRSPADKGLSSNLLENVQSGTALNERQKAGAGWPFNHRDKPEA